jgi:hypothetical protein
VFLLERVAKKISGMNDYHVGLDDELNGDAGD